MMMMTFLLDTTTTSTTSSLISSCWRRCLYLVVVLLGMISCCNALEATLYTDGLELLPGQVFETFQPLAIPPLLEDDYDDNGIAITSFRMDCVEKKKNSSPDDNSDSNNDDEYYEVVPVSECYLHHMVVQPIRLENNNETNTTKPIPRKGMESFRFGTGAESHGTMVSPPPSGDDDDNKQMAFVMLPGEHYFGAAIHVINLRGVPSSSSDVVDDDANDGVVIDQRLRCLECPCIAGQDLDERGILLPERYNITKHEFPGVGCTGQLLMEEATTTSRSNSACSVETYSGGVYCCKSGNFCYDRNSTTDQPSSTSNPTTTTEEAKDTYYVRVWIQYEHVVREEDEQYQPMYGHLLDVTANETMWWGNIEYDVPQLCANTNASSDGVNDDIEDRCIHTIESVVPLYHTGMNGRGAGPSEEEEEEEPPKLIELAYMIGHQHRGGIGISAYLEKTGELLCHSKPTYDPEGVFLIAQTDCYFFDQPNRPRLYTNDLIRIVSKYDARQSHTGVMGLIGPFFTIVDSEEEEPEHPDRNDDGNSKNSNNNNNTVSVSGELNMVKEKEEQPEGHNRGDDNSDGTGVESLEQQEEEEEEEKWQEEDTIEKEFREKDHDADNHGTKEGKSEQQPNSEETTMEKKKEEGEEKLPILQLVLVGGGILVLILFSTRFLQRKCCGNKKEEHHLIPYQRVKGSDTELV